MELPRYIDNTKISDYRTCPRYYYYRHIRHWRPARASIALINGSAWHEAMNTIWAVAGNKEVSDQQLLRLAYESYVAYWVSQGLPHPDEMSVEQIEAITPRGPFIAKEVLHNYIRLRRDFISQCEILDIERPFAIPLIHEGETVALYYVGRLDKVFKHPQYGKLIGEHKTTSWYATKGIFRQEWVESFSPNSQIDGYLFSAHAIYGEIRGVWIDGALMHKKVFDGIKFIPIDRQFEMIDSWLAETFYWIGKMNDDTKALAETSDLGRSFAKNTGSCGNFGGCPYRDICRFYSDPHRLGAPPDGFKVEEWNPFDVLKLEKLELDNLHHKPN